VRLTASLVVFLAVFALGLGPVRADRSAASVPLYLSPSGSDAGPCTSVAPCASLARALAVAAPGQVVRLQTGAYPGQALNPVAKPSTEHVVFQPAPGASVSFTGRLELDGVSHVTLSDFTLARTGPADRSLFIAGCTTDVTLQNLTGETFFVEEGTSAVNFRGGSWGGYSTPGEADSAIGTSGAAGPTYTCGGEAAKPATNIVFDGVLFHDVFWGVPSSEWGGSHPDCFEINGYVAAVTVRNSRFVRCASTFMQINPDQGDILNATFEKNVYKQLGDESWYGIQITSAGKPARCGNVIFRRNTYLPSNPEAKTWPDGPIRTDCEPSPGTAAVLTSDNLFQRAPPANECARYQAAPYNTQWQHNLFLTGSCGTDTRGVPFGYGVGGLGLVADGRTAGAIRRLYALASRGLAPSVLARRMAGAHAPRPPGSRWNARTIRLLLRDPVYAGGAFGATGANPPLVSSRMWRAAQAVAQN
jgi:hypothetical protein